MKLLPGDLAATRLFLLSHADPLVAVEVADRAAQCPERVGATNRAGGAVKTKNRV